LLFAGTATCPRTVPEAWSNAATRCGAGVFVVRAPRTVFGVDGDDPSTSDHLGAGPQERPDHLVQQARVDTGEGTPDRGLPRACPGPDAQPCQHRPALVGDPLTDRGERARTGQDRRDR
jgi:hypothetical protein